MRPTFLARLVNGPLFDPAVYVKLLNLRSALMFDCGRFEGLSNREILCMDSIFISHLHMDHLMGLDQILRVILHRDRPLNLYGPEGAIEKLTSRLGSYTWNLTRDYSLEIMIQEVHKDEIITCSALARNAFKPVLKGTLRRNGATIESRPFYSMDAVVLDHNVPCLGFLLQEPFHINIRTSGIGEKGYTTGEWISDLKRLILAGRMNEIIEVPISRGVVHKSVEELSHELVVISRGQKIAYITDIRASDENIAGIRKLADDVDILFIETYYLAERAYQAFEKAHLTASDAGKIAGMMHARKVIPMHISPRYHHRAHEVIGELEEARAYSYQC